MITKTIDSLDLEKQIRKRNGLPIKEIEERQKDLIDSLSLLKQKLQIHNTENSQTFLDHLKNSILKPENFFDWIFVIVAVVASISGLFLFIGILSFFFKKNIPTTSNQKIKKFIPQQNMSSEKIDQSSIDLLKALTPAESQHKDVSYSSVSRESDSNSSKPHQKESTLQSQVLEAAKKGLDVHEISRLYHISVDHAALILKISETNHH